MQQEEQEAAIRELNEVEINEEVPGPEKSEEPIRNEHMKTEKDEI